VKITKSFIILGCHVIPAIVLWSNICRLTYV